MHHTTRNELFLLGALAGGAVATLTTLLFTTKKGEQIKDTIIEKCQAIEEGLAHTKEAVEEGAHDAQAAVKKGVQKLKKDE